MHTSTRQLARSFLFIGLFLQLFLPFSSCVIAQNSEMGVVATADSLATQIAYDMLQRSGNAIDAGVAAMFALAVTKPYAASIGGGGLMMVWNNQTHEATLIDFRSVAPKNINPAIFYKDQETFQIYTKYGYQSICVPGMIAGATKALSLQGTMTLQELLQPAIQLASTELIVTEALTNLITQNYDKLEANHASAAIYLPDWYPLKRDQTFRRDDLIATLNLLASRGGTVFYHGEIATEICSEVNRKNGFLQQADFTSYRAELKQPASSTYRNLEIFSPSHPLSDGVALIEVLKILEKLPLKKYHFNSGPYIHDVVEAMKVVREDQEQIWKNSVDVNENRVQFALSPENILRRANQIDSSRIKPALRQDTTGTASEIPGTTHISIVDRSGNAVAISLSINSIFGSGITSATYGILLNNGMRGFSDDITDFNAIQPGKRPTTHLMPTLLIKNNRPYLALGGNGNGTIVSMLAHIIIGVVEYHLSLNDAIMAPRFHYDHKTDTIEMESRIDSETIEYLKRLGYRINLRKDYDVYFGSAQAVMFDPADSNSYAANDVRHTGVVCIDYQN